VTRSPEADASVKAVCMLSKAVALISGPTSVSLSRGRRREPTRRQLLSVAEARHRRPHAPSGAAEWYTVGRRSPSLQRQWLEAPNPNPPRDKRSLRCCLQVREWPAQIAQQVGVRRSVPSWSSRSPRRPARADRQPKARPPGGHLSADRVGWMFTFAAAVYNLVRMRNLAQAAA